MNPIGRVRLRMSPPLHSIDRGSLRDKEVLSAVRGWAGYVGVGKKWCLLTNAHVIAMIELLGRNWGYEFEQPIYQCVGSSVSV